MCCFSFSPQRSSRWSGWKKQYQLKGHAKFVDIARLFGWEQLDAYLASFMLDDANNVSYATDTDEHAAAPLQRRGQGHPPAVPLLGHPSAEPRPPSPPPSPRRTSRRIPPRSTTSLLHYKTLVPANNAAFRTFAMTWWGQQTAHHRLLGGNRPRHAVG